MDRRRSNSRSCSYGDHGKRRPKIERVATHLSQAIAETKAAISTFKQDISDEAFYTSLSQFIPTPTPGLPPPKKRLRDAEFDRIADLCNTYTKSRWKRLPRHFFILYMIGHLELMDDIVDNGWSDISLPYREDNLPEVLTGQARRLFYEYQNNVLTGHRKLIEQGGQEHQWLAGSGDDLFICGWSLGRGGFGEVDEVVGKLSWNHFARKRIPRGELAFQDKQGAEQFENEMRTLKKLSHQHVVKLVGTYTDQQYMALIMRPVADADLAKYLAEELGDRMAQRRRIRLRSFFGCIATAIDYLHQSHVRHKDIKPSNILIKGEKVYITDFGTSHHWEGELADVTEGTLKNFTRKYIAPEAFKSNTRSKAMDIYALGCVFLEMCTVLAGKTIKELKLFMSKNGSGSGYYCFNQAAITAWSDILTKTFNDTDIPQDGWLLDLVHKMCKEDPDQRPTAEEIVSHIFNLKSIPPYYGLCCSPRNTARGSGSEQWPIATRACEFDHIEESTANPKLSEEPENMVLVPTIYIQPSVEDADLTVREAVNIAPNSPAAILEDITEVFDVVNAQPPQPTIPNEAPSEKTCITDSGRSKEGVPVNRNGELNVDPTKHDSAVPRPSSSSDTTAFHVPTLPVKSKFTRKGHYSMPNLDPHALPCPWPNCKPEAGVALILFDSVASLRAHLLKSHSCHDFAWTRIVEEEDTCLSLPDGVRLTPETGALVATEKRRKVDGKGKKGAVRFTDLPQEWRPSTVSTKQDWPALKDNTQEPSIKAILPAAPAWAKQGNEHHDSVAGLPASSLVPSYILASTNRLSQLELLNCRNSATKPVFVCGTLMFPSILKAIAQSFITTEGTYSSHRSRRLRTGPSDWSRINESIQKAAEYMTPSILEGYSRFRKRGSELAYVQRTSQTGAKISGFLIFGLSEEALACLDHLYEKGGPQRYFQRRPKEDAEWDANQLQRKDVKVKISIATLDESLENTDVDAVTYVACGDWNQGIYTDYHSWNIERFIRSPCFSRLVSLQEGSTWIQEEEEIANKIGTRFVLTGDHLVQKIMENDSNGLRALLSEYCANSASAKFGTALQAAAYQGREQMVDQLIKSGARVNAKGGEYGSPLIAAVVQNHRTVVKMLLREKADVFTPGGRYVSALYQAVDFDNVDIAHLLLERGAWLTTNYSELVDLATERNNREMCHELETYNVHNVVPKIRPSSPHKKKVLEIEGRKPRREKEDRSISQSQYGEMGLAMAWTAIKLQGQEGKWTGIKGVHVMRVALDNGMDKKMLETIRPHIHSWPTIQTLFANTVGDRFGGRLQPVKHTDPVEEEKGGRYLSVPQAIRPRANSDREKRMIKEDDAPPPYRSRSAEDRSRRQ